jgi:hypothetical protein
MPPPAIVRYFDPFVGTGLGSQQLLDAFDFGGFSPSVNFMMMPIHADLLRLQAIEFNDQLENLIFHLKYMAMILNYGQYHHQRTSSAATPFLIKFGLNLYLKKKKQ